MFSALNQNLNSLHEGDNRSSHAFFTKVLHLLRLRKCMRDKLLIKKSSIQILILIIMLKISASPCITEGKYRNQLEEIRKFRVVLSFGGLDICTGDIKVTAYNFAEKGLYKHIFFWPKGHRDV